MYVFELYIHHPVYSLKNLVNAVNTMELRRLKDGCRKCVGNLFPTNFSHPAHFNIRMNEIHSRTKINYLQLSLQFCFAARERQKQETTPRKATAETPQVQHRLIL